MRLLNCGLITKADEIETQVKSLLEKYQNLDEIPEDIGIKVKSYEKLIEKHSGDRNFFPNKNVEALLDEATNTILKGVRTKNVCLRCRQPMKRIQNLKNRILMTEHSSARKR